MFRPRWGGELRPDRRRHPMPPFHMHTSLLYSNAIYIYIWLNLILSSHQETFLRLQVWLQFLAFPSKWQNLIQSFHCFCYTVDFQQRPIASCWTSPLLGGLIEWSSGTSWRCLQRGRAPLACTRSADVAGQKKPWFFRVDSKVRF